MGRIRYLLEGGNYRKALKEAMNIQNPLPRLIALAKILEVFPRDEVLAGMFDTLDSIRGTPERAVAHSILGRALYSLDRDREAELHFDRALELAETIGSPRIRGEVLAAVSRNLVLSERYGDALDLFTRSVELLQRSRGLSPSAVESLIGVARLIEKSADGVPNEMALAFYRLARDVYTSISFNLQAKYLEEKMRLVEDVLKRGKAAVRELIETGDVEPAIEMARFLPLEERAVVMLELSYWFHLHEQPKLGRRVFDDALEIILVGKFKPPDRELMGVARRFLRIGLLEEPLLLAGIVGDEKLASRLLGEIALAYSKRDPEKARSIAEGIRDESVKRRVLKALEGGSDVGYEQGLPLISGGEGDRALSEDD
ncbi:tetratricopeptide repeat protein [Thermococcus sp.]|uniref:tetratricopeptide repeat protein n=1 Tax=Thermococcus sp. TaxID=35749 RepID=UPI00261351E4|nr:tetratricopeptide repeat protein [Thermococcus sp.]